MSEGVKESVKIRLGRRKCSIKQDRKSTRLNSSHSQISYAVFCLKKKKEYVRRGGRPCLCRRRLPDVTSDMPRFIARVWHAHIYESDPRCEGMVSSVHDSHSDDI